ncbi:UDP-N-acetylmuramoyl-L-alanyl-D-glutamate--2,6-diaminopimelate ligase [Clostridium tepidiprofundi DSM 19306]|uniref:UDP-N-acetylmuramoyl-L-alanyl-D-glutamate--2,6-diaminopimelate ligase n=1 Tax=Clostridium tepidiprofundi DSM 19306 TaxID=1121338 RepID=A0A151B7D6_9CLOT|nr:UDP-N-acetylmuramoyl-L-alanyl-D-glutamate--2,6-diaminopimelate ligase [Clostridium tepidiprofundi]KYH35652.1 UDP-N-acetylmuramoyl-L-alanyl-D-glutamate--2,6-diaminopimelate ligase [Clostridium tepidiprofundi DSM 19306]
MKLKKVLLGIDVLNYEDFVDIDINKIEFDSRKIEKGDVFFCILGYNLDGHDYAEDAIKRGASVIVCEKELNFEDKEVVVIMVKDTRKALAICSSNYYGNPSNNLNIIGVTGTNGKTTSTYMLRTILQNAGYKVGIIGTIANYIGDEKIKSHRTTPESLELHKLFKRMSDKNVDYCIMEVSSHSLALDRVYGIKFNQGLFTNLTQDHLDFHKDFEDYFNSKFKLFKNSSKAVVNIDDKYGQKICKLLKENVYTYAIKNKADFIASNINMNSRETDFDLIYNGNIINIKLNIPGKYNVYNALGCIGSCINEGISIEKIVEGLKNINIPGRCEVVSKKYDLGFDIIVDYAHTPDGLENILLTAREFTKGRLISVFGCGGDRDNKKRPIMGKIGSEISDLCIITSDNPRTEPPMSIIQDIIKGISKDNYIVVENRKGAIRKALAMAKKNDTIVIAGKGHEDYQILNDKIIHFDEREIIDELVKELF